MKKIVIEAAIMLVMMAIVTHLAGAIEWQEGGIPIRQGDEIWWKGSASPIGEDKMLVVWSDTRSGYRYVWAQTLDEDGKIWEDDLYIGKFVTKQEGESYTRCPHYPLIQLEPSVIQTSDGNVVIAWVEIAPPSEEGALYAQKITEEGSLLWGTGNLISSPDAAPYNIEMVADNEGGVHITWSDYRTGAGVDIYGMHLNADGEPYSVEWVDNGLLLAGGRGNQHLHTLHRDGEGGFVLAYVSDVDNNRDLHIKRVAASGETIWERALAEGDVDYANVSVTMIDEEHFGFAYTDRRDRYYKVYVNIIDIEGEDVWDAPLPVDAEAHGLNYDQRRPRVTDTADAKLAVVWEDYRTSVSDIYVQKFNLEGERLFNNRGTAILIDQLDQLGPSLKSDQEGNVIIVWEDGRDGGHPKIDIYAQKINPAGEALWEENGRQISDTDYETFDPIIGLTGDEIYFLWGDRRSGSTAIYIQGYDAEDNQIFNDSGFPVAEGISGCIRSHSAIRNGEYVYVVWVDERYHFDRIKVQKIDSSGNMLFAENGISVTEHTGTSQTTGTGQISISAVPHHGGGIALTWIERRDDFYLVYVQAISPEGEMLWGDKGVRVSATDNVYVQENPHISRRGEGYVIVYDETDPGDDWSYIRDIRAQKIVDGVRVWGDEGVPIAWQFGDYPVDHLVRDVLNGEYIVWRRGGQWGQDSEAVIYAKRIDEAGNPVAGWGDYGLAVCDYPGHIQTRCRSLLTGEGLMILWEDRRAEPDEQPYFSIYGQLISPDGEIQWAENGIPIADYYNDQTMVSAQYDDGSVYLTWRDSRNGNSHRDIAFQKIDLQGGPLWGEPAPFVIQSDIQHNRPVLHKSGNTVLTIWENDYRSERVDLYMQLASAQTGELFWGEAGKVLVSDMGRQVRPMVIGMEDQTAFVLWEDARAAVYGEFSNLYAQKVDMFSELSVDEKTAPSPKNIELYANYPNPFNPDTNIAFDLAQNEKVSLKIYNIRGQLVRTLLDDEYLERGRHSMIWDGRDDSGRVSGSGIYFYKLSGERETLTRKMVMIK